MKIPVFLFEDGIIERIDTDDQCTPLLQSSSLLESILHKAETEDMTYILSDSFEAIYGAVKLPRGMVLFGPVLYRRMTDVQKRQFNKTYGNKDELFSPEVIRRNSGFLYGAVSGGDDDFLYDCLETLRKKEFLGFHKERVDRLERELLAL